MKITFLGGGNMAAALIGGLIERGFAPAAVQVIELGAALRTQLGERFGVRAVEAADGAALDCEVLVLAVKPQQMRAALAALAGLGGAKQARSARANDDGVKYRGQNRLQPLRSKRKQLLNLMFLYFFGQLANVL